MGSYVLATEVTFTCKQETEVEWVGSAGERQTGVFEFLWEAYTLSQVHSALDNSAKDLICCIVHAYALSA